MTERFSFTKMSTGDHCLAKYESIYEADERIPKLSDSLRDAGSAVHACIQLYKEHLQATGAERDLEVLSLIVEDVFSNNKDNFSTDVYDDVFWLLRQFALMYSHKPETYIGSEFLLQRALPETDDTIEGYPDHVETQEDKKGPIVVSEDVKSGYKSEVSDDMKFQGEIAAWMLIEFFPEQRTGWRVTFPRHESRSEIVELDPRAVPRLEGRMRSIIAKIRRAREEKLWPATPGAWCKWCPLAATCRERNVAVEYGLIVDTDELARKAAFDYVILEAALSQREGQLKQWAKDAGPVELSERESLGYVTKHGGPKITDVGILVLALGTVEAIAQLYSENAEDPMLKTDDGLRLVTYLGLQSALKIGLLSVNGNKTKATKIQNDERLRGLWSPGDIRTEFGILKNERVELYNANR